MFLVKACYPKKKKKTLFPQFFPLVFSMPQNYNVQIHKHIHCFCTLEINTKVWRECRCSPGVALGSVFLCRVGTGPKLLSVCLSGFTQPRTPNYATDY